MKVLYLGDGALSSAASYLAGVMTHFSIDFDYRGSGIDASDLIGTEHYDLFVLSDYAAKDLGERNARRIVELVADGAGLLMIGGWESFHGVGGNYDSSVLATALPVRIAASDDRVNWSGPCVVRQIEEHAVTAGLEFDPAPVVGGFNRLEAAAEADVILVVDRYAVHGGDGAAKHAEVSVGPVQFEHVDSSPLLACGVFGQGRSAAFATDAAPHWVGGFVDWGRERVAVATDDFEIEVGDSYVRFFGNLLEWCGKA